MQPYISICTPHEWQDSGSPRRNDNIRFLPELWLCHDNIFVELSVGWIRLRTLTQAVSEKNVRCMKMMIRTVLAWGPLCPTCRLCIPVQCALFPYCHVQRLEYLNYNNNMYTNMYANGVHCLICMVIIHSNINNPPQHPQLNDCSFIYFQLFTGGLFLLLVIASLSGIAGGGEGEAGGILCFLKRLTVWVFENTYLTINALATSASLLHIFHLTTLMFDVNIQHNEW